MVQANMLEAKTNLSQLVHVLETHQEDKVYIARNNIPVVQTTLIKNPRPTKRIGMAKGKLDIPPAFDEWDSEVADLFQDALCN